MFLVLFMSAQGSELLVLRGSLPILHDFKFIKTEVADFETYEGCCQLSDIKEFMIENGYKEFSRKRNTSRSGVGGYFDIIYKKKSEQQVSARSVAKRPPAEADSRMRKYFSTTPSPSSVIPANLIPFALPIPHLIRS